MNEDLFPPEWVEMYLLHVWTESITKDNLSIDYHLKIANELENGVLIGFEDKSEIVAVINPKPKIELLKNMKTNVYQFSAAKQYQQVMTMSKFINQKGERSTFKQFKELAKKTFKEYNEDYLRTEYNTAIGQAQSAREWNDAVENSDQFPMLMYRTQRDKNVRDEHAILDGVVRPIDDPFWDMYMPKNGWNCRCFTVSKSEKTKKTDLRKVNLKELNDEKKFPPIFRMNPGKDGIIFSKQHPYFRVSKGDLELKKQNFKLPIK